MTDFRLTAADHASLMADLDDLASRAGGILSRATRPRTLLRSLEPWTEPEPPAPAPATVLGACPLTGGMSATAVQRVLTRWGDGAAVRAFSPSGWTVAPVVAGSGPLLYSWKPTLGVPLDRVAALAALAPLPAGSKVAVWHEPDVKARKGAAVAPMIAAHREFAALVRAERPDLSVMGVLSAWTWQAGFDPTTYIDPTTFDILGVDLDDPAIPSGAYTDYRPVVDKVLAWMAGAGITRWTVPEFGLPRSTADSDGTKRAAWMGEQVTYLRALTLPPEEIALFESTAYAGTELTAAVETEAWSALIG